MRQKRFFLKRVIALTMALTMALGMASTASAAGQQSLADKVLEYGFEYYDTIDMQGGNSHMQGTCVDDKGEYMYFSYTSALVKVDMKTGEVVGSVGGFGQGSFGTPGGAHLGDLAYYDGKIYGSLEYKEPGSKFFICVFDEDAITDIGMDMKEMETGVYGILLKEPTEDFRDPLNDIEYINATRAASEELPDNGFAINNDAANGHALGCSGIDGVAFTTLPGDTSGKIYMFVAYGIFTDNNRFDNNYNVIVCYDPDDFTEDASCYRRFTYERGLDSTIEEGEMLEGAETYYVWTGHTNWGTQVLETDLDTGDLVLFTYARGKTVTNEDGTTTTWPGKAVYCVDMSVAPYEAEIEVGQSNTITDPERKAAVLAEAEVYKVDTDGDGVADAYPKGKHLTLKCVCGNNCQPQEWPETGVTSMICGLERVPGTATYGANSLGDGYWLISNGRYKSELYSQNPDDFTFSKVCPTAAYSDVAQGAWYHDSVDYVVENGIMQGVSTEDSVFDPEGQMLRAAVWTTLARLNGAELEAGTPWYASAQEWAIENEVSDGSNPTGPINREEMVTMLYRYAQMTGMDVSVGEDTNILSYPDAADVSEYAVEAMQWACGAKIISGAEGNTLVPQRTVNRSVMATILQRFCELGA